MVFVKWFQHSKEELPVQNLSSVEVSFGYEPNFILKQSKIKKKKKMTDFKVIDLEKLLLVI